MSHRAWLLIACLWASSAYADQPFVEVDPSPQVLPLLPEAEQVENPQQDQRRIDGENENTKGVAPTTQTRLSAQPEQVTAERSEPEKTEKSPSSGVTPEPANWVDKVQAGASVAIVFLTIYGAYLLTRTLRETKETLRIARDTQNITQTALEDAQRGLALNQEIAERSATVTVAEFEPYFEFPELSAGVTRIGDEVQFLFFFKMENVGKSIATNISFEKENARIDIEYFTESGTSHATMPPQDFSAAHLQSSIQPGQIIDFFVVLSIPTPKHMIARTQREGSTNLSNKWVSEIELTGSLVYSDIFGRNRICRFALRCEESEIESVVQHTEPVKYGRAIDYTNAHDEQSS